MNLKGFRDQYPSFRPYAICMGHDGRKIEIISWPYEEDGNILIKGRTPGDPTTMQTYQIVGDDPDLINAAAG